MRAKVIQLWSCLLIAVGLSGLSSGAPGTPDVDRFEGGDFAFVQISDIHLSPHLEGSRPPGKPRGARAIEWLCRETAGPQEIPALGLTTPAPAFGLATGDLTEYGVIDDTWALFEKTFAALPYPLYVLPGNHDNTWVSMHQVMRERHGGDSYSFDEFGCHFVCLNSASPQEPVPTIEARTRAWLRSDLDSIPSGTPVFVALHHPPDSSEFAPSEYDTFIDILRDYNVVLVLYGHGHAATHSNLDGLDGVMGGSTFGAAAGYSLISVQDGQLRVTYRYHDDPAVEGDAPGWRTLLEKPLSRAGPRRVFRLVSPGPEAEVAEGRLRIRLEAARGEKLGELSARIDGEEVPLRALGRRARKRLEWEATPGELTPGAHLLSVRARGSSGATELRTTVFHTGDASKARAWSLNLGTGIKAEPVIADDQLVVAGTDGIVRALDRGDGSLLWSYDAGGEVLGRPAWNGELLVFGSGNGKIQALDARGEAAWSREVGVPVYGRPLLDGELVYVGDNGGRMHALELGTGAARWTFSRADYAIESGPCLWNDLLVFGAWDGRLRALQRDTGELKWEVWGPKSAEGRAARYYAPADCAPVVVGDRLLVCDRGYVLGTYAPAGAPGERIAEGISAIRLDPSGRRFYARCLDQHLRCFDSEGEELWATAIPTGRFPIPPTLAGGRVYACSNDGLLSVLNAADGSLRRQHQVTPGFSVMAPVVVDEAGVCYVAGMDGTVCALR